MTILEILTNYKERQKTEASFFNEGHAYHIFKFGEAEGVDFAIGVINTVDATKYDCAQKRSVIELLSEVLSQGKTPYEGDKVLRTGVIVGIRTSLEIINNSSLPLQ